MNKSYTKAEREYVGLVKTLPCSVCNKPGPSYAHHPDQDDNWTVIALCYDCHQDGKLGIHGQKVMWTIMKMDELKALGVTIRRIVKKLKGENHVG